METHKKTNGLRTFLENFWFLSVAIVALVTSQALEFFKNLSGTPWICFLTASFTLMIFGGGLITCAKLPVYRSGRFFTFGLKSVPKNLQRFYRLGWCVFLFGVFLALGLLLSKP
ncbi:MAG TPA: hypothetical protein VH280_23190 [Verrucomicrobiae bacterium]|jgi:hypothetical protein|nr:hypothetical protein [Verrucomicrobiae bacterium]